MEYYLTDVLHARIYAIGGSFRDILRNGLFHDYAEFVPLPSGYEGGIVDLAAMVVDDPITGLPQTLDEVICLIDPKDPTSTYPETSALKRECVVNGIPFLSTYNSSREWATLGWYAAQGENEDHFFLSLALWRKMCDLQPNLRLAQQTIALVAHDQQKTQLLDYVVSEFAILRLFGRRLGTGTTAALLSGSWPERLEREIAKPLKEDLRSSQKKLIKRLDRADVPAPWVEAGTSGPRGGDVLIARRVLHGECQKLLFFEDPHVPHEHAVDIQLLERTCRVKGSPVLCLHDRESAVEWARRLRRCIEAKMETPLTLYHAFRLLFGAEVIIVDLGSTGLSDRDTFQVILRKAAYHVYCLIDSVGRQKAAAGQASHVAVSWGRTVRSVIEEVEKVEPELQRLTYKMGDLELPLSSLGLHRRGNVIVIPLVGMMGLSDPRSEANSNARFAARILDAESLSNPNCVFLEKVPNVTEDELMHIVGDELQKEWSQTDVAVFTCDQIRPLFGEESGGVPARLYDQLKTSAEGELAGLGLTREGRAVSPRDYYRIGMSFEQIHGVARRGGAVLISALQERRIDPTLAALRGGLVSTLITNREFAGRLIEKQLQFALE